MRTIRDTLRAVEKNVTRNEIEIILAHALKKEREFVLTHPEQTLSAKEISRFESLLKRRKQNEPIAYILGHKEFFGRDFFVNKNTLVPRPETETLIEIVIRHIESEKKYHEKKSKTVIIDMGTGSGNIIITLIKELERKNYNLFKNFSFFALDISRKALSVSRKNAHACGVKNSLRFMQSDMFSKFPTKIFRQANSVIILANLPYLSTKEYQRTSDDIQRYEPKTAIESGETGLEHPKKLLEEIKEICEKEGCKEKDISIFFEIGSKQKKRFENYTSRVFPRATIHASKDLSEKWRFVFVRLGKN